MATLIEDNAYGTLASGLAAGDITLNFTSGHGARFPAVVAPDVMYACILNTANVIEEVKITAHTANADSCTIVRAQGGTTAKVWAAGDRIEARISQQVLGDLVTQGTSALAVNVQGGGAGQVVYQVGTSSTGFVLGTTSDILMSNGTGAPTFIPRDTMNVGIASTATTALFIGTASLALTAVSVLGGHITPNYVVGLNNRIITSSDCTIEMEPGATHVTLPAPSAATPGRVLQFMSRGTLNNTFPYVVTVVSGTYSTSSVIVNGGGATLVNNGTVWLKIH